MFKRERGKWQKTLLSARRPDFCTAIFNPAEIWAPYVANMPKEQKVCPFKKDVRTTVNYLCIPS